LALHFYTISLIADPCERRYGVLAVLAGGPHERKHAARGTLRDCRLQQCSHLRNHPGDESAITLLEQTLKEEKETDQKLAELAKNINIEAAESGNEPEESPSKAPRKSKAARALTGQHLPK
jgi:hypothetical protein